MQLKMDWMQVADSLARDGSAAFNNAKREEFDSPLYHRRQLEGHILMSLAAAFYSGMGNGLPREATDTLFQRIVESLPQGPHQHGTSNEAGQAGRS